MQSTNMNKVESACLGNWLAIEREQARITLNSPTTAIGGIMGYTPKQELLSVQYMSLRT